MFGFVTSEGKSQQQTSEEGSLQEKTSLIPQSFSEQMKEVYIFTRPRLGLIGIFQIANTILVADI